MGQRHHHGEGIVEQEFQRLAGSDAKAHQAGIDHAVIAQDDLPGEDAQQIAGPERNGQQRSARRICASPRGRRRNRPWDRQAPRSRRHQGRNPERAQEQGAIARPPQHLGILGKRAAARRSPGRCWRFRLVRAPAGQGRGQRQRHDRQGGREQGIAFAEFRPSVRHAAPPERAAIVRISLRFRCNRNRNGIAA